MNVIFTKFDVEEMHVSSFDVAAHHFVLDKERLLSFKIQYGA